MDSPVEKPGASRGARVLIVVLVVAAAGLLAARWAGIGGGTTSAGGGQESASPASRGSSATTGTTAVTPAAAPAPRMEGGGVAATPAVRRPARGAATPGRDAYERARSLAAVFNALRGQSDPDALFFAERALRDCMQYAVMGAEGGQPAALERYRPAAPDDPATARRKASYASLQSRCSGFDLGDDPGATLRALREALATAGGPHAALEQATAAIRRGDAPADAMQQVKSLAADGDPYLLEQAGAVMGALRGRYVFMLDGQLVRPDIVAAGWMMAACDAGRSCGEEWVQAPCAYLGECDARDLESSLQRYQLTPAEFDRVQQVRARVMQGISSGQWDPALFSPQMQPPWYRRSVP